MPSHSPSVPMAKVGLGFTASVGNIVTDDAMELRLPVRVPSFIWPHTKDLVVITGCAHNLTQLSLQSVPLALKKTRRLLRELVGRQHSEHGPSAGQQN